MPEPELFLLFVRPLNRAGIRYVVTGSIAAMDMAALKEWLQRRGLEVQWEEVKSK